MHRAPDGLLAQRGYFGSFVPLPARQASPTPGPKGSQDVPRGLITCRFGTQLRWLVSPELARLFQQPDLENHWVPMRNWALPSVMAFVAQATHPAGALLRDRQAAARRGREHGPEHRS